MQKLFYIALLSLPLAACGTAPTKTAPSNHARVTGEDANVSAHVPKRSPYAAAEEDPGKRGDYVAGGLYAPNVPDSAPDYIPDVDAIPEPVVKVEPRSRYGNRSYAVLGKTYRVLESSEDYLEEGLASFYGRKFHGRLTSNQEVYDMNAFTAAHRSLPLPSYARVTNLENGKSVIVRINDRGPFHSQRLIDLSYAAAVKLDMIRKGTVRVEVRALHPDGRDGGRSASRRKPRSTIPDTVTASTAAAAVHPDTAAATADPALRADQFDQWMQERGIHIASGKAASTKTAEDAIRTSTVPEPAMPTSATSSDSAVAGKVTAEVAGTRVLLQLAAFSTQSNAERAKSSLEAGGVSSVRIDQANANGQPVWRLRVGPVAPEQVPELSTRCADLGFAKVQIVRE